MQEDFPQLQIRWIEDELAKLAKDFHNPAGDALNPRND
jgi:hypothetical protein